MPRAFQKAGLKACIRELNKVRQPDAMFNKILRRLAEEGALIVKEAYSKSHSSFDSMNSVRVEQMGNRFSIVAESEGLLYLEFGAGIGRNPDGAGKAREILGKLEISGFHENAGTLTGIGEFGFGLGMQSGGWWYKDKDTGERTFTPGTVSRHGFANAYNHIMAIAERVINEEVRKWQGGQ